MLDELAGMEGPALEGVTLSIVEERQAGIKARTWSTSRRPPAEGFPGRLATGKKLDYLQGHSSTGSRSGWPIATVILRSR